MVLMGGITQGSKRSVRHSSCDSLGGLERLCVVMLFSGGPLLCIRMCSSSVYVELS